LRDRLNPPFAGGLHQKNTANSNSVAITAFQSASGKSLAVRGE